MYPIVLLERQNRYQTPLYWTEFKPLNSVKGVVGPARVKVYGQGYKHSFSVDANDLKNL